ncbi:MAG: peptidase C45 [Bacteroidetes bacterium]|nr:peptidase C45 [Bacteroidota bacterium]
MKRVLKVVGILILLIFLSILGFFIYINALFKNEFKEYDFKTFKIDSIDNKTTHIGPNWLREERPGLWTLYVEGKPFERGLIAGQLTKDLVFRQEKAFVEQIHHLVPSDSYLKFLKYVIGVFDYNLYHSIPEENKKEIYGVSFSASSKFTNIASNYQRILNYHGAHDMGHMLNNLGMVGCTSFGVWNSRTVDGDLLIGRNFDFYVGDDFSKEKIVEFVRPDSGYRHAFITWGGMIGAVSGMNEMGLTVTINAANSDVKVKAATPVAIVARQILQYASNINEAVAIASHFDVFVSELFLIGSALDNRAIIIEKRPGSQVVFDPCSDQIISTNHFQSRQFGYMPQSLSQRFETASGYRYRRMHELLENRKDLDVPDVVNILRNMRGIKNADIGLGNEDAINQLIAHHSIVFNPRKRMFWISTSPYQLGEYVAYDLKKVFASGLPGKGVSIYRIDSLNVLSDKRAIDNEVVRYSLYKLLRSRMYAHSIKAESLDSLQMLNPNSYETYELIGDYYFNLGQNANATRNYWKALKCIIPNKKEVKRINDRISKSKM